MKTSNYSPSAAPTSSFHSDWLFVFPALSGGVGVIIGLMIANFLGWI